MYEFKFITRILLLKQSEFFIASRGTCNMNTECLYEILMLICCILQKPLCDQCFTQTLNGL